MSIMRNVAAGSALSLLVCASAAMAQQERPRNTQPDRQNQNQDRDRRNDQDRNQDRLTRDRMQDRNEFGQIRDGSSPLAQMSDLSGLWEVQVTYFDENDRNDQNAARGARTATGIAERRWILDGSVMMERYSLAGGGVESLPLNDLSGRSGMTGSQFDRQNQDRRPGVTGRDQDSNNRDLNRDATRDPNRDLTRDPAQSPDPNLRQPNQDRDPNRTADRNRDQINRDQDRRNINDPSRNRLAQGGVSGHPTQGIVLWGYDAGADEFTVVWTDDMTSGLRCDTGKLGDDGRMTLTGSYYDPTTQETYDTRIVIDMVSPEMQRLTMYTDAGLLSEEKKHMEIVYRRAGAGSFATPSRQTP